MLTIHKAVIMALVTLARKGYQTCRTNIVTLTMRMNIDSTDIATLYSVNLFVLLVAGSWVCERSG
jgi:hypothetical protein